MNFIISIFALISCSAADMAPEYAEQLMLSDCVDTKFAQGMHANEAYRLCFAEFFGLAIPHGRLTPGWVHSQRETYLRRRNQRA